MILVDTSVLLDILQNDPTWAPWSLAAFAMSHAQDDVAVNDIIFAELSARYERVDQVENVLNRLGLQIRTIPRQALFLSGKAFQQYRLRRGAKNSVLSDFFIGAHALVEDARLLTRDVRGIRTYFPAVTLITP